jgi:hypothetical protein
MTAKQLATLLGRRVMGNEISESEERLAREAGLVVVFGYSDDNVELRGAINGEVGAYNGTTVYLSATGLLENDCDSDRCPHFERARERAASFKTKWDDGSGAAWTFDVPWPHFTFEVFEEDELFCRGVVFALAEVLK